ncbi:hypothetical protein LEM8419_02843 [Neolewinella maritima]|uniref:HTH tetR-type domain-containing protein n=1 Tax=Neolewinella maritima TaxID=1383882 RepID=A0ABM9B3W6_9BACT|nr:TetR/AcrR family transcriptional regulator [Neolewinella maritima]CAH1001929.1 hypothetical protein LEM8419_02843 [Neolewinella maritima]
MERLLNKLHITISDTVFLKNPETSDLGRRIITGSIDLLDALGLEQFTFRKLAQHIGSTEASVYRYFENKHKLLLYLVMWYWGWMEYRLVFRLANVEAAEDRLRRAIELLTQQVSEDSSYSHINEVKLSRIVVAESLKAYLTRDVDEDNQNGAFAYYKQLVVRVGEIIAELNPDYPYPHMLVTTIVEGGHVQRHFAEHLPRLTDLREGEDSIVRFYTDLAFKTIC